MHMPSQTDVNYESAISSKGIIFKIFFVPFFIMHYGGFMLGHLMFIFFIYMFFPSVGTASLFDFSFLMNILPALAVTTISLFISHGISFYTNFIKNREYEKTNLVKVMFAPYPRIFVMHLTIIFGGLLLFAFNLPQLTIALLVLLKIIFDLRAHKKEHSID